MNEELYMDFERYLAHEMPADEKSRFEEKLQKEPSFRESFELYKETTQFLETKFSAESASFRQNLKAISDTHFEQAGAEKETKVIHLRPWYYAVAASMAIVFGTLIFNQADPQYSDYNSHETAVFTERGTAEANLKQAQDFFNGHQYQKAVASFEKLQDLQKPELQYFYAIALIETSQFQKAGKVLNALKAGTSVYKDKAAWYLALSYLKQHKTKECKALLQQIPADADEYAKAQELLDDLD